MRNDHGLPASRRRRHMGGGLERPATALLIRGQREQQGKALQRGDSKHPIDLVPRPMVFPGSILLVGRELVPCQLLAQQHSAGLLSK